MARSSCVVMGDSSDRDRGVVTSTGLAQMLRLRSRARTSQVRGALTHLADRCTAVRQFMP
jgi:hypothetical protein